MAAYQGYELVKLKPCTAAAALDLGDLQRLHHEGSEAVSALMAAIADKVLTPIERKRILKELGDLRHAIAAIEAKVEAA
ncbi:MAG: hypothetical protein E5V25_32310 [Mesorhizobium sp.]|nr:MAG: hypothetical protein E5V25_32310 [Mesorhizobium sp.]